MKKVLVSLALILLGTSSVLAYEYTTYETVHYVLRCMDKLGGQTEENAYTCSCQYDVVREKMPFSEYEEGYTFERNKPMPGEKGAAFRDNERGKHFYEKLVKAKEEANASCIEVQHVKLIKPTVIDDQRHENETEEE